MQTPAIYKIDFTGDAVDPAFEGWRDQIGRHLLRCDYQPTSTERIRIEHRMHVMPHMTVGKFSTTPVLAKRTRDLIEGDSGDVLMVLGVSGSVAVEQASGPFDLRHGSLAILDVTSPSSALNNGTCLGLRVDRSRLKTYCPHVEDLFGKPLPRISAHTALLLRYLEIVTDIEPALDAPAIRLVEQHVLDLLGLAIGASGDVGDQARRGGLRAARAEAIRHSIAVRLQDPALSLSSLAREYSISERYIQLLFEEIGTSFTDYVMEQRLHLAHRMLLNPALSHQRISDIAFGAGFGDLSHFNRCFKRQYGETPSDTRKRGWPGQNSTD